MMIGSQDNYSINKTRFAIVSSNNLTILQQRFFNHILYEQEEQKWTTEILKIESRYFHHLIGNNGKYRQANNKIKKILKQLLTKELKILNSKYEGYEACTYISYFKIHETYIEIKLENELKKHLNINYVNEKGIKNIFKGYSRLNLNIVNKLCSTYSIALYEYSFSKLKEGEESCTFNVKLDELTEVASFRAFYKEFKYFKRDVLVPSIKEINSSTDIEVEYELVKKYNKIHSVNITVTRKNIIPILKEEANINKANSFQNKEKQEKIQSFLNNDEIPLLKKQLVELGITINVTNKMYEKDSDRLRKIYAEVSNKYKVKTIKEKQALIVAMFKNNALVESEQEKKERINKEQQILANQKILQKQDQDIENKKSELATKYKNLIDKFYQLPQDKIEELTKDFHLYLKGFYILKKDNSFEDNKNSKPYQAFLGRYLESHEVF